MTDQLFHGGLEVLHQAPRSRGSRRVPLLFLHGAFAGAWIWAENFLAWFARRGYPAYALSFRGHGASKGADELHDLGTADYVEDVRSVLALLQAPPVLIGHSMGGFIVQKVVEEVDLPAYVVMASVPPTGLLGPALTMVWLRPWLFGRLFQIQYQGAAVDGSDVLREAIFWNDVPKPLAASYLARMQNESRQATLDLYWPEMPNLSRLRRVPGLVLGARHDRFISVLEVYQTAALVGTSPIVFPDMGHAMMLEAGWERVAHQIHGFLT